MTVELATLLAGAKSVASVAKDAVPLVNAIRSGMTARNERTKQELTTKLTELQENLQKVGQLARVLEVYSETHDNLVQVLTLCQRAERTLRDGIEGFRNQTDPSYVTNWKILDTVFEALDSSRESPRKAVIDRIDWYDKEDEGRLDTLLRNFTSAYERAATYARIRTADDLVSELRAMVEPLREAQTILRSTMFDRILRTLQDLGH